MMIVTALWNKRIMHKSIISVLSCSLVLSVALLSSCSDKLDDKKAVFSYVEDNIEGLTSFCESVENTSPYFESITHTNNHAVSEADAAEIIDGMYAVGRINDSLFYEEVSYDFVEEPLAEGLIDSITMYVDYTLSYGFSCHSEDGKSIGFYYTESDKPLFCGREYDFDESEGGYKYALANGSEYYTERICENWFFYQMQ